VCDEMFDSHESGNCPISLDEGRIDEYCQNFGFHITGCFEITKKKYEEDF